MTPIHLLCCSPEGFFPFFPVKDFFGEIFLIRCEVKGQGCRMCTDYKALWGKFAICDNGIYKINWSELRLCTSNQHGGKETVFKPISTVRNTIRQEGEGNRTGRSEGTNKTVRMSDCQIEWPQRPAEETSKGNRTSQPKRSQTQL